MGPVKVVDPEEEDLRKKNIMLKYVPPKDSAMSGRICLTLSRKHLLITPDYRGL